MVLKIGIDQITRSHWTFLPEMEPTFNGQKYKAKYQWISANYVNDGEPREDRKFEEGILTQFNFGFNDFVVVECTPEMAYQIHGASEPEVELPPEHPRAARIQTAQGDGDGSLEQGLQNIFVKGQLLPEKQRSGYATMAYGWGDHANVLDFTCETNEYIDVEGPPAKEMYGEPYVKLIPLMIPGGLAKNDTFWIDLNKGVRALYFPARYQYGDDFPNDVNMQRSALSKIPPAILLTRRR